MIGVAGHLLVLNFVTPLWVYHVCNIVTEPYLDEVFHVRQAQAYCNGQFSQWDPKITTPPGLYLVSWLLSKVVPFIRCDLDSLRLINACLPSLIWELCFQIIVQATRKPRPDSGERRLEEQHRLRSAHTALNICLFPPLFFFTTLYYTDVISTTSVLLGFWLRDCESLTCRPSLRQLFLFINGLAALSFRQTNILWVAVFPAILDVIDLLAAQARNDVQKRSAGVDANGAVAHEANDGQQRLAWSEVLRGSFDGQVLYDRPLADAAIEDWIKVPVSVALAAVTRWRQVIQVSTAYLALLSTFAAFIAWNGGVVLGDKSNHIATLHLAQMLYIWPLIAFFSWPLLLPHVLAFFLPTRWSPRWLVVDRKNTGSGSWRTTMRPSAIVLLFLTLSLGIARYNTIVHPFTLADNRHYMFYVFRILLRHPSIKYAACPVYVVCGWAAMMALRNPAGRPVASEEDRDLQCKPDDTRISYVLAWLATTTLTLVTAPLVEPRYFILPWIFWRLAVPSPPAAEALEQGADGDEKAARRLSKPSLWWRALDIFGHGGYRLWVETAWLLAVHTMTEYMFLYKGFAWLQEPGRIQRFMW